ncbi:MAG: hydrogenase maturation nickel metallochaperone HypA [Bacteroidales bacterium]|jgi:hydrogenase nickel incorporation protein HypA/HybF
MHEIGIAENLSEIVLEAARNENLSKVTKVNIRFGQLVQIVPDIFEFAFRETVRDTLARDAEICIEIMPVRMKCNACGKEFSIENSLFACNGCGSSDLKIIQGKELFVTSIEGE